MFAGEARAAMMIEIRGASNAKAKRERGWRSIRSGPRALERV